MKCIVCAGISVFKYELYDDRYGYPKKSSLYKCLSCKHKFLSHNFSESDLESLYTNYYPRSDFSIDDYKPLEYKKGFISWFNGVGRSAYTYVPENVSILDIGCGFGQSLGYHSNRGCDVYGVEADSNIEKVANKYKFNVKVGLFNPSIYEEQFFDYVTMDQVLEHTTNPIETLQGVSKILKKDGILVISIPNSNGWGAKFFGKKWINWHAPYHLQHFSKKSIKIISKKSNFELVSFKTITSSEWLNYQWLCLTEFPKLGEKSSFWSPLTVKKSTRMKIAYKLISWVHKIKINHIITRLFDAIGYGDNYIIILKRKENI